MKLWRPSLTEANAATFRFPLICLTVLSLSVAAVALFAGQRALFFHPDDRAADFLKVILALPGGRAAEGPLDWVVRKYATSPDYHGVVGVLHLPPLTILVSLLLRWSFDWFSPVLIYISMAGLFLSTLSLVVYRWTRSPYWVAAALICYPVLFALDRGNLYAGLSAIPAISALLRKRSDWRGAWLFALAMNVRPNIAVAALPLLLCDWRFAPKLALSGLLLGLISFCAANALFPAYTPNSFIADLHNYAKFYLPTAEGVSYGSSIYGALFMFGYNDQSLAAFVGLAPLLPAVLFRATKKLHNDEFVFICVAVSGLATAGYRDYHLMIFLAPLLLTEGRLVAIPSLLMLAPKGFIMWGDLSAQVLLNPAIAMVFTLALLLRAHVRDAGDQSRGPIVFALLSVPYGLRQMLHTTR